MIISHRALGARAFCRPATPQTELSKTGQIEVADTVDVASVEQRLRTGGFLEVSGLPPAQSVALFCAMESLKEHGYEFVTDQGPWDQGEKLAPLDEFRAVSGGRGPSLAVRGHGVDMFVNGGFQTVIGLDYFHGSGVDRGLDKQAAIRVKNLQDKNLQGAAEGSGRFRSSSSLALYQTMAADPRSPIWVAQDGGPPLKVSPQELDRPEALKAEVERFTAVCGKLESELFKHRLENQSPSLWQQALCRDQKFDWEVRAGALARLIPAAAQHSGHAAVSGACKLLEALEQQSPNAGRLAAGVMELVPRLGRQSAAKVLEELDAKPIDFNMRPVWTKLFEDTRDFAAAEQGYRLVCELATEDEADSQQWFQDAFCSVFKASGSIQQAESACRQVPLGDPQERDQRLEVYRTLAENFSDGAETRYQTVLYRRLPEETLFDSLARYTEIAKGGNDAQASATVFSMVSQALKSGGLDSQRSEKSIARFRALRKTTEFLNGTDRQAMAMFKLLHRAVLDGSMSDEQADKKVREMAVQQTLFGMAAGLQELDSEAITFEEDTIVLDDITITRN